MRTFQDMIIASVPGEIVHGDKLRFILKKGNCCHSKKYLINLLCEIKHLFKNIVFNK